MIVSLLDSWRLDSDKVFLLVRLEAAQLVSRPQGEQLTLSKKRNYTTFNVLQVSRSENVFICRVRINFILNSRVIGA